MKKLLVLFLIYFICPQVFADDSIEKILSDRTYKLHSSNPKTNTHFERLFDKVTIPIEIDKTISTKQKIGWGQSINFHLTDDVKINNKTYKKGTSVSAKLEHATLNQAYGVPADIIVSDFRIDDTKLDGTIQVVGARRSNWIYPVAYGGAIFTLGGSLLLLPIRGGHAKIKQGKKYEIYYIPAL